IRCDAERLHQVTWNLLVNAIKFTPKNGLIRVSVRRIESDIELAVEDNGEGIEPSFLPHVFDIFRQSDASVTRVHGGLGIGLSIAKNVVELHGGSISVRSPGRGAGATFTVRLPVGSIVSTTLGVSRVLTASTVPTSYASFSRELEGKIAVIVDDDPDARELVAYLLEACGMVVRTAAGAADAKVELMREPPPDVLLSDIE